MVESVDIYRHGFYAALGVQCTLDIKIVVGVRSVHHCLRRSNLCIGPR